MRILKDQQGVEFPSPDYPKGRIKNNETLINEEINGDLIQFFQKLIIDASVTENSLPDSHNNGYQLIEALNDRITSLIEEVNSWQTLTLLTGYSHVAGNLLQFRHTKGGNAIQLRGAVENTDNSYSPICTLPSGARPIKKTGCQVYVNPSVVGEEISVCSVEFEIATNRLIREGAGIFANNAEYFFNTQLILD